MRHIDRVIPPASKTGGAVGPQYSPEGPIFGNPGTPNSFFFEVTGMATEDMLRSSVGAARSDMSPRLQPGLLSGMNRGA